MVIFILALYIIAANGFAIPDAVWTISWVAFGLAVMKAIIETIDKYTK